MKQPIILTSSAMQTILQSEQVPKLNLLDLSSAKFKGNECAWRTSASSHPRSNCHHFYTPALINHLLFLCHLQRQQIYADAESDFAV